MFVDDNVSRPVNTATSNLEGVFLADVQVIVQSNGGTDLRFNGEGTFVGWTAVDLQ